MFPPCQGKRLYQTTSTPGFPLNRIVNNSSVLRKEHTWNTTTVWLGLHRNNRRMEWKESETLNRHSPGPGGSEASDELSSRLFVLQRLMSIQMDWSREGTEWASIFPPVCLTLPNMNEHGDSHELHADFNKTFHSVMTASGTTVLCF